MVILSKILKDSFANGMSCNDIVHSGPCTTNVLLNTYKFLFSNMKHFAPVIGLPLFVHIRSLDREVLKSTLKYYIGAVVGGTATGWSIMLMICLMRHIFGKFNKYTFLFLPSFIGGLTKWIVPHQKVQRLFENSIFQCTIESFILQQKSEITKFIANSEMLRTFIFMCCSGLIMNAKRVKAYKGFWLMEPTPCRVKSATANDESAEEVSEILPNNSCNHRNKSCTRYAIQGIRNYMIIGLTLDIMKMLMGKVAMADGKGFMVKLLVKIRTFKIRSCALLTSYIAIYRLLHCYLNRNNGGDSTFNHTMAAFVSGSCFIFYPKLTLMCYALVLGIQIIWQRLKAQLTTEVYGETFEWINRLPFNKILYPLALGYLVHTYCVRKQFVSGLGETIINGITNNYARSIYYNVEAFEQQNCQLFTPMKRIK